MCLKVLVTTKREQHCANTNKKHKKVSSVIFTALEIESYLEKVLFQPYGTVYMGLMVTIIRRIFRGQGNRINMVFRLIFNPKMTYEEYLTKYIKN